jgi:hypothetical protein
VRKQSPETKLRKANAEIARLQRVYAAQRNTIDGFTQLRRIGQEMAHILFAFSSIEALHKNDRAYAMKLFKDWDNTITRQQ